MMDRNLARGLFLAAIALAFGLAAMRYPLGTLGHAGPGLFPLMMSGTLLLIALLTIVRSRFAAPLPLDIQPRNIGIILLGLVTFAVLSRMAGVAAGTVAMVFVVSLAANSRSWGRSARIAAGLVAVAVAFQKLLGLHLPLY